MYSHTHFLVTIFHSTLDRTYKCAISVEHSALPEDDVGMLFSAVDMPAAGSSKAFIRGLLPPPIRRIGPILELEVLPELVNVEKGDQDFPPTTDPHIVRMNKELIELTARVDRLASFMLLETFRALHHEERALIMEQHVAMVSYCDVLSLRFSRATST